ncbi:(2Fe-2S)-binding protein [Actinomadura madurae]|uniref:(2Fe-2S)-binding protein n=1 Tax=Actinomadura madurae TaxID=1993 RepID=UPI0020D249B4|nr:(2Fe-2S)-binding protein [Actinomadura madurae]MCQ0016056.1 (2Fe-2S)-binding protein [Actinomadura madurae]
MYVCICNAVTEDDVRGCMADGCTTAKAVKAACGFKPNCGSCTKRIHQMVSEYRTARASSPTPSPADRSASPPSPSPPHPRSASPRTPSPRPPKEAPHRPPPPEPTTPHERNGRVRVGVSAVQKQPDMRAWAAWMATRTSSRC